MAARPSAAASHRRPSPPGSMTSTAASPCAGTAGHRASAPHGCRASPTGALLLSKIKVNGKGRKKKEREGEKKKKRKQWHLRKKKKKKEKKNEMTSQKRERIALARVGLVGRKCVPATRARISICGMRAPGSSAILFLIFFNSRVDRCPDHHMDPPLCTAHAACTDAWPNCRETLLPLSFA